jgi:hypothetical protein
LAWLRQLPFGAALFCFFVRHRWVARRTGTACEQLGTEARQICLHNETSNSLSPALVYLRDCCGSRVRLGVLSLWCIVPPLWRVVSRLRLSTPCRRDAAHRPSASRPAPHGSCHHSLCVSNSLRMFLSRLRQLPFGAARVYFFVFRHHGEQADTEPCVHDSVLLSMCLCPSANGFRLGLGSYGQLRCVCAF